VSRRRALELAADSREAPPRYGVRWKSTSLMSFESHLGVRRKAMHAGGGSQPEEPHGLAAEVLRIDRRRKNPVQRVFEHIFPYTTSFAERRLDPRVQPTPPLIGTE
jgi:hypothetical protein